MAVGFVMDIPDGDQEFYDTVCRTMNWPEDWPDGQIGHYAGPTDGGWRVVDIWESREHFERFAQERLMAAVQEASGGQAPPLEPQWFDVYREVTSKARV